jgi:uncharacterized protein (DUF952 family)
VPGRSELSGRLIYHCSLVADWNAAQAVGAYTISSRGRTLEQEGFVHASYAGQIAGVLQRFYADVTEPMCLLVIDADKLGVPVIAENLVGGSELFPHIYGPIPVAAVVEVAALVRDGRAGWRSPSG